MRSNRRDCAMHFGVRGRCPLPRSQMLRPSALGIRLCFSLASASACTCDYSGAEAPRCTISLTGPADLVRLLIAYPLRWLVPAVLVVLAAGGYAVLRPDTWEASQALIIRNEAAGNSDVLGKFHHEDEMKTLLETVLELAKSRSVLAQTLEEVGPPANRSSAEAWPSDEEITLFCEAFKIVPPKGAEFGKTEVFYLKVMCANTCN